MGRSLPGPTGPSSQTSLSHPPPTPLAAGGPQLRKCFCDAQRAPGMLIHGSPELPVKYAVLGYGLCLSL